jgi:hypothetical protein
MKRASPVALEKVELRVGGETPPLGAVELPEAPERDLTRGLSRRAQCLGIGARDLDRSLTGAVGRTALLAQEAFGSAAIAPAAADGGGASERHQR